MHARASAHTTFKCGYLRKPAEGTRPGARVIGSYESFERDARNLTRVLWKNGECCQPLSQPS